jgi:L-alanine-DL-glutamate epimerase-like enolase superfamily enzyme
MNLISVCAWVTHRNETALKPRLTWERITLKLRNPFRLSYGTSEERQAYWLRLENDEGWGEGTIPPYYHVDQSETEALWQAASQSTITFPEDVADIGQWVGTAGPAPARCALDLALHDRIGRRLGVPLYKLLGLPKPKVMTSSFTIAIDSPAEMARMARQFSNYSILKIKLGGDGEDLERLAAIREARPDATLRIDANAGWTVEDGLRLVRELERFELEMIEQPVAKEDIEGMGRVQAATRIPIVADESVQTIENIEALGKARVRGINLKLMKTGGLTPAVAMLKRARELGLQVMLGCMIETSIGTTAMAHLAGMADWLDLDAPVLISNDPFVGMNFDQSAAVSISDRPGIGVARKNS